MLRILNILPKLEVGGVERGCLELDEGLREAGHYSLLASAGGQLLTSNRRLRHVRLCSLQNKDPISVLVINPLLLWVVMRRHRIDILHVHSRSLQISALIACALCRRVKLVAT